MTRKDRKRYSREFKLESVRQIEESGKPVTAVARDLGVSVHLLYRWRDEVQKEGQEAFPGKGHQGKAHKLGTDTFGFLWKNNLFQTLTQGV